MSSSLLPHTTLLPHTMPLQSLSVQFSPQTTFWPLGVRPAPHETLLPHAVPPGVSTPPLTRVLPQRMCLLHVLMFG